MIFLEIAVDSMDVVEFLGSGGSGGEVVRCPLLLLRRALLMGR